MRTRYYFPYAMRRKLDLARAMLALTCQVRLVLAHPEGIHDIIKGCDLMKRHNSNRGAMAGFAAPHSTAPGSLASCLDLVVLCVSKTPIALVVEEKASEMLGDFSDLTVGQLIKRLFWHTISPCLKRVG